jgi:hypothetical protein
MQIFGPLLPPPLFLNLFLCRPSAVITTVSGFSMTSGPSRVKVVVSFSMVDFTTLVELPHSTHFPTALMIPPHSQNGMASKEREKRKRRKKEKEEKCDKQK